jgi:hypothetical protein
MDEPAGVVGFTAAHLASIVAQVCTAYLDRQGNDPLSTVDQPGQTPVTATVPIMRHLRHDRTAAVIIAGHAFVQNPRRSIASTGRHDATPPDRDRRIDPRRRVVGYSSAAVVAARLSRCSRTPRRCLRDAPSLSR